jgi:hypothetical protein
MDPAFAALGAKTLETLAPAEKKEKSIFSKSKSSKSLTSCSCSLNSIICPADLSLARRTVH